MTRKYYRWQCKCCQAVFYGHQRGTVEHKLYGVPIKTRVCPECNSDKITCISLGWITDTLGDDELRTTQEEDEDIEWKREY